MKNRIGALLQRGRRKCSSMLQRVIWPIRFAVRLYLDDQVLTNSATITLFTIMSLFPMLMLLLWLMTRLTIDPEVLLETAAHVIPQDMMHLFKSIVDDLHTKTLSTQALSLTVVLALWSASSGISCLVTGLNRVYKREEKRNWFVHRGLCLMYTAVFMTLLIVVMTFLVYGTKLRNFVILLNPALEEWMWLIAILQYVTAIGGMIGFFLAVYNIFPQKKLPFRKQLPGAVFSTIGWYGFSEVYSVYIRHSQKLAFMYGSLTVIIVFLVWMFGCINIILIGGELNFLYNNRYYYKLFLLTEQKINIQEYFIRTSEQAAASDKQSETEENENHETDS